MVGQLPTSFIKIDYKQNKEENMKIAVELDNDDLKVLIRQLRAKCEYDDRKYPNNENNSPRAHRLLDYLTERRETLLQYIHGVIK